MSSTDYYNTIAEGYDELHREEQLRKLALIAQSGIVEPEDTILDVGCGTGFSLECFTNKMVGIDPAEKLVARYGGKKRIMVGCAEELPFADHCFDVVISVTAIQNFDDLQQGLSEIRRVGRERFAISALRTRSEEIHKTLSFVFRGYRIETEDAYQDILWFIYK